jgi:hypothetical protein
MLEALNQVPEYGIDITAHRYVLSVEQQMRKKVDYAETFVDLLALYQVDKLIN